MSQCVCGIALHSCHCAEIAFEEPLLRQGTIRERRTLFQSSRGSSTVHWRILWYNKYGEKRVKHERGTESLLFLQGNDILSELFEIRRTHRCRPHFSDATRAGGAGYLNKVRFPSWIEVFRTQRFRKFGAASFRLA